MGDMTLQNFRDELTNALARGIQDTARLDRWINQALLEFGHVFRFKELERTTTGVTSAGVNVVTLPADFRAWHEEGVWITAPSDYVGRLLRETRKQYLGSVSYDTDARGIVEAYHIYGKNLYFRPFPDATAVSWLAHYWATVTKFIGVNDVSQFDADWDDVIFTGALYRGYRHFGEFDRYQNVRNDFLGMVRSRVEHWELEEFPVGGIHPLGPHDSIVDA